MIVAATCQWKDRKGALTNCQLICIYVFCKHLDTRQAIVFYKTAQNLHLMVTLKYVFNLAKLSIYIYFFPVIVIFVNIIINIITIIIIIMSLLSYHYHYHHHYYYHCHYNWFYYYYYYCHYHHIYHCYWLAYILLSLLLLSLLLLLLSLNASIIAVRFQCSRVNDQIYVYSLWLSNSYIQI